MIKAKVCGITNLEDALMVVECGADAVGFVFASSPRQVSPETVCRIVGELPPFVCKVGVFVDSTLETVREVMDTCGLDLAQLHGSESPDFCRALFPRVLKAFRVRDESVLSLLPQYQACAYLLDSYDASLKGGTGRSFNWDIGKRAGVYGRIVLSGGLTPENVRQAIEIARPYAVDVSSGVESCPGKKDPGKVKAFLEVVKG